MNNRFLSEFFEKTYFPAPAREYLTKLANSIPEDIDRILAFYETAYDHEGTIPLVEALAQKSGCSAYSIWMIVLILAAEKARPLYRTEKIYWDTFCDLRYKAQECYDVHGIWGTFVAHWYPRFSKGTIVKLGRLQYEVRHNAIQEPVTAFGITVKPEDPIIFMHIPSSGEPFDSAARLESYRRAHEHFCANKGKLVCVCASWLLYPGYEGLFGGNIADFRRDFHILKSNTRDAFGDKWRVFGKDHKNPPELLPENTSLQRAFKAHILNGGSIGSAMGVLIFDGEKVITRNA